MAQYTLLSVFVLLAVATSGMAQYNSVQESSGGDSYFSGLMDNVSSLSEMDWQGMLRSVVETLMQYFVAPTTRAGAATSRALSNFEGDLVVNFVEKIGGLLSLPWSPSSHAPASVTPSQMVDLASASPRQMVDPASASSRQTSSTPSPVSLAPHLRKILGPNPHLSDNKLLKSWEYAIWMMSYCVACILFGVLSVTLLPDPKTLELIRGGGGGEDAQMMEVLQNMMMGAQNMMMGAQNKVDSAGYNKGYRPIEAAQNMVGAFGATDDTDGYYQGFGEQNNTGGREANTYGTQDIMSNAGQDTTGYDRYRTQDTGVVTSAGSGKKKPSKRYNRYKDNIGEPPKNYPTYWAQFNNKQKTYLKSAPKKQSPENNPPSTHYQVIHGEGEGFDGSQHPFVSGESSYTSYSSQPS